MAKPKKSKPSTNANLDSIAAYLRGQKPGEYSVAKLVADVIGPAEPGTGQVTACIEMMRQDERFEVYEKGMLTYCRSMEVGHGEPEELTLAEQPEIPDATDVPAPTESSDAILPGAIEVKTIGEHVADAEAKAVQDEAQAREQALADHIVGNTTCLTEPEVSVAGDDISESAHRMALLRTLLDELEALESEWTRLKKAAKSAKDDVDGKREQIAEAIRGETQDEVEDKPVFAAHRETTPPAPQAHDSADFRHLGEVAARAGAPETVYLDNLTGSPDEKHRWLQGWRTVVAEVKVTRRAEVQALFRDGLQKALMAHPGFLPAGEEQPKVAVVKWDERDHLVLDFTTSLGEEVYFLQALYDRDEWATLYAETYGEPILGMDKGPDERDQRIKGGVDCGRLVKAGRSIRVVGPRQMVSLVSCDPAEQPSH